MALEALANAIAQAGRDYFNYKREDETHARDRTEKLADEQRARDYQKQWFEYENTKGLEYKLKEYDAMSDAELHAKARTLGVNPEGMTRDQIGAAMIEAERKVKAGDIASQRKAEVAAKGETFGDEQALQDRQDLDKVGAVYAQYHKLQNEMEKLRNETGIVLPDQREILAPIAEKRIREAVGDTEASKEAFFNSHGLKTAESRKAWQDKPVVDRAQDLSLLSEEDIKGASRNANNQMMSALRSAGYDVEGMQRRMAAVEENALKLGVNLQSNWEDLPIVQRTHAPNPIKATPPGASGSASSAAAAAAQKEYEEEAAKHVSPVTVTPQPQNPDNYGGLVGWWNNTQWNPSVVSALKSPLSTISRPFENMIGGTKFADQQAAARDSAMQSVASWFTPISEEEAFKKNLEAGYGTTMPDMSEPQPTAATTTAPNSGAWANNYYNNLAPQPTPFAPKPATGLRDASGWSNRYFSVR